MSEDMIFGIIMCSMIGAAFIGIVIYFLYFYSRVEQKIKKHPSKEDFLIIVTTVIYCDNPIKEYTTECHYNDGYFDDKAAKDLELAKIYLARHKKYL